MQFFTGWRQGDTLIFDIDQTRLRTPLLDRLRHRLAQDSPLQVGLRPEHFYVAQPHAPLSIPCEIDTIEMLVSDAAQIVYVQHGSTKFCAKLSLQQTLRLHEAI
jgi:ABC-type sugar transport system ATPase subunit